MSSRVVVSIFFMFTPKIGEESHFDEHIFEMGWFNYQPARVFGALVFNGAMVFFEGAVKTNGLYL